jgi:hypothetical protein
VTALDFIACGVVFTYRNARMSVRGPNDPELRSNLQAEIERRKTPSAVKCTSRVGTCQRCGDKLRHYRGGDCELCICAVQKQVDQQQNGEGR